MLNIYRIFHQPLIINNRKVECKFNDPIIKYDIYDYSLDNMNYLNSFYSEFVAFINIYKEKPNLKYIGFEHYRRFTRYKDSDYWRQLMDDDNIIYFYYSNLIKDFSQYKYIVPNKENDLWDLYILMDRWQVLDLFYNLTAKYIREKYPEILKNNVYNPNEYLFIERSIFLCNWKQFEGIYEFINGWIELVNKKYSLNYDYKKHNLFITEYFLNKEKKYDSRPYLPYRIRFWMYTPNTHRIFSFILEFLLSMYIKSKKYIRYNDGYKRDPLDKYFI